MSQRLAALIAVRQLLAHPHRLLGGWVGVGAAIVLVAVQVGMRTALYESAVRLHQSLDAELVIISPRFVSLSNQPRFPIEYLYRAGATPGVSSARPLYTDAVPWRSPATGITRLIYVFGMDVSRPVLTLPAVNDQLERLLDRDAVLFDRLSRPEFGPIVREVRERGQVNIALSVEQRPEDPQLRVEGLFTMGPTFVVDGNIICSDLTFHNLTNVSLDRVTIGVLKLDPAVDLRSMQHMLKQRLGPDVRVLTKAQLIALEKNYWAENTAIGFVFDLGLVVGFLVGVVFDYQVLYTLVHDNITEYAIMKSLGYSDGFLRMIVVWASLIVGLGAILPFGLVALGLCAIASQVTALQVRLDRLQMAIVAFSALAMCMIAAAAAIRRLRDSDPVDLFG